MVRDIRTLSLPCHGAEHLSMNFRSSIIKQELTPEASDKRNVLWIKPHTSTNRTQIFK